jgi:hypothetical protein
MIRKLLAPDLALATAAVTLFYCLFFAQGYQSLFRDSDAGWHIRNGETILASGRVPHADPYSFSRPGQPWFAWEWGADVVVGAFHRAGGLRAVALLYAAAIAAGVWLWFRLHWALKGNFLFACAMTPLLLSTCNLHWLARPHIFSWLFLLGALWWAERRGPRVAWQEALALVLWANIHGSFFMAAIVAAIYAVRGGRRWYPAVAVAVLAPLANPYGWNLYTHLFRYLTDSQLLARIGEFQSFDFHTAGSGQIIAALILGMIGASLALAARRWERFALGILITAMALRSARALPIAALLLLPIANAELAAQFALLRAYSGRLRSIDARMGGLLWAPLLLLAAWAVLARLPAGFPADQFPVAAYPHIPAAARLFAPDKYGGYLIYRSAAERKVFFDGRSDFYGADFLDRYGRIVQVRPGWRAPFDAWHFTHALLPLDAPLGAALELSGWRRIHADRTALLLQSPSEFH